MNSRRLASGLICALMLILALPSRVFAANDPFFGQQWGLHRIHAEPAWGPAAGGSGVVVAVVDTGVNFGHEDLAGKSAGEINTIARPRDACDSGPGDNNGHGTQVAGIIAAASNNDRGIASVAPGSMILSVKALDCNGEGYLTDVSRGIRQAARHGARVINLSLGHEVGLVGAVLNLIGQDESRDFQAAINEAADAGALVVAAAGNDSLQSSYAGMENVLVVGASGPDDEHSSYSSSGAEIMAPGGNAPGGCGREPHRCVATTGGGGGYAAVQGTSFSAPHVSGVAALLSSQGHDAGGSRSVILSSADSVPAGRRVNAAASVGAPVTVGAQQGGPSAALPAGGQPGSARGTGAGPENAGANPRGGASAAASPPGSPGSTAPDAAAPAGTLILGASQGAPPEVSRAVAGYADGAGAGGRAVGSKRRESDDGSPLRNASILALVTVAAGSAAFVWQKRRLS